MKELRKEDSLSQRLDEFFKHAKFLLFRQQLSSGLFPTYSDSDKGDGISSANLVDNVFVCVGLWSLSLSYRRLDDDDGRQYLLEQSVVKCYRGLLFSMMQQSSNIDKFKTTQDPNDAPCLIMDLFTGSAAELTPMLSISSISLWILYLAQFTLSGLKVIFTTDEVNFVQNLVYCIERAYRTPDFSVWGGDDPPELRASSIGMAKAALESIDGVDLFFGTELKLKTAVIHVDPDPLHRCRAIFHSMLPKESTSKETDGVLLSAIGFPAFAADNHEILDKTYEKLCQSLRGRHGFKRFLGDVYEGNKEPQFPNFAISASLLQLCGPAPKGVHVDYFEMLDRLLVKHEESGLDLLPEAYFLQHSPTCTSSSMDHSRKTNEPLEKVLSHDRLGLRRQHSSPPTCSGCSWTHNKKFPLWSHSMLMMTKLLKFNLLSLKDIDPVGRAERVPTNQSGLWIQGLQEDKTDKVVHVCLIVEHERLQNVLSAYGIEAQTTKQIEPINIRRPAVLIELYQSLGKNWKMNLSGRPPRPMGSLATSKVYRIRAKTFVFHSVVLDITDFYMSLDLLLLIDKIKDEIRFLRDNWTAPQRPLFCLMLTEAMFAGENFGDVIDLMASIKLGRCNGVKTKLGRMQQLVNTSHFEHLEFLSGSGGDKVLAKAEKISSIPSSLFSKNFSGSMSLSDDNLSRSSTDFGSSGKLRRSSTVKEDVELDEEELTINKELGEMNWSTYTTSSLLDEMKTTSNLIRQAHLLYQLALREDLRFRTNIGDSTLANLLDEAYETAGKSKRWSVVRLVSGIQKKVAVSLAPAVTELLVRGLEVEIGPANKPGFVISEPIAPAELARRLFLHNENDFREAVLQQELLLFLSAFIISNPKAFSGMLCVRLGHIIEGLKSELALRFGETSAFTSTIRLMSMSPYQVKKLLADFLTSIDSCLVCDNPRIKWSSFFNFESMQAAFEETESHSPNCTTITGKWLRRRYVDGLLMRVKRKLYPKVRELLKRVPGLVIGGEELKSELIQGEGFDERKFSRTVERWILRASRPEERIIYSEILFCLWLVLVQRLPELILRRPVYMDELVDMAVSIYSKDHGPHDPLVCSLNSNADRYVFDQDSTRDLTKEAYFFSLPRGGKTGTICYLAKAVVRLVQSVIESDGDCVVS